jgi:MFS family permease
MLGCAAMSGDDGTARAFGGLPRSFWTICVGTFINRIGWFVLPFLTIYLTEGRHRTSSEAGLVVSIVGGGLAIGGVVGGIGADRVGRRFTMLVGLAGGAALLMVLGAMDNLVLMALVAAVYGLVSGMYSPSAAAFVADVVPPKDRARAYGLSFWAANAGTAIGAALGGIVAGFGFSWLFIGDAGTTLIFAVIVFAFVTESRPAAAATARRTSFTDAFRDKEFVAFIALAFVFWFIFHQSLVTLALDMRSKGISQETYGLCIAINGTLIVLLQPWSTPRLLRYRSELVLAVATLITGAGFAIYSAADTPAVYALGAVIWTLGEIAFAPRASAIVAELAPAELRGRYQGAYVFAVLLSLMVGPAVGATVWEHLGRAALWLGLLGLSIVAALAQLAIAPARSARLLKARELAAAK